MVVVEARWMWVCRSHHSLPFKPQHTPTSILQHPFAAATTSSRSSSPRGCPQGRTQESSPPWPLGTCPETQSLQRPLPRDRGRTASTASSCNGVTQLRHIHVRWRSGAYFLNEHCCKGGKLAPLLCFRVYVCVYMCVYMCICVYV